MMDNKGQMSGEYLLLIGCLIFILILGSIFIISQQELTTAMTAARNGVNEGMSSSAMAIYSKDTFKDYSISKSNLLHPYNIEIINISYDELGTDKNYDKTKIQFKVYAKTDNNFDKSELVSIGDRINYNLRKSIAISFNSSSSTNKLYNPVFSQHYVFTTANVKWI